MARLTREQLKQFVQDSIAEGDAVIEVRARDAYRVLLDLEDARADAKRLRRALVEAASQAGLTAEITIMV